MKRSSLVALLLSFCLSLGLPAAVEACSVCMKGATPDQQRAYFWGILMLLCLPFILFSIIGGRIYWSQRQKSRENPGAPHGS